MSGSQASSKGIETDIDTFETPMIDIIFQLITFFMFMMNMKETEQNEHVTLPDSVLAIPKDEPIDHPITVHVAANGDIYFGGARTNLDGVRPYLTREVNALAYLGSDVKDASFIIRGHRDTPTGTIQELMRAAQEEGFENFMLRAREDVAF